MTPKQSQRTRVSRDSHGERTRFEDLEVGAELGTLEWTPTLEDVEKQCELDDDWHDWFMVGSPFGGRVVPPQIQYRPPRWLLSRTYNIRGLFYRWEMENIRPIVPGETLLVSGRIKDKWIANDREYVEFEFTAADDSGDTVFTTRRVHVLDVTSRAAPREGVGIDSGKKSERL